MKKRELQVMKKYFGCPNKKDAETLAAMLHRCSETTERVEMMNEYCARNPERCEYFQSKRGTELVKVTFETGETKQFEVRRLATTPARER